MVDEVRCRSMIYRLGYILIECHNHDNTMEMIPNLKYVRDMLEEIIASNFDPSRDRILELTDELIAVNKGFLEAR